MEELRKKAKQLKEEQNYDEAVKVYSEIYSNDCDKWLGWEYSYCLKKLGKNDEAIEICKRIYSKEKNFKYNNDLLAWLLFEVYFKDINKNYTYKEINHLYEIAIFISKIVHQDENSPYEKVMLKTLKILKHHSNKNEDKILGIIGRLDVKKLSDIPPTYVVNNRKQEFQSNKEMFYVYKSKALYSKKSYQDCIECCEEALTSINKFHHDNEIWIESRKALCVGQIESIDVAIDKLKELSAIKNHWIFHYEIGQLYQSIKEYEKALLYYCRAAITSEHDQMKVTLYFEMALLIEMTGDNYYANMHALYSKYIRDKEGWNISTELNSFLDKIDKREKENNVQYIVLQDYWIRKIYEMLGEQKGTITSIAINGKFGFVRSRSGSYYFKTDSTLGRFYPKQNDNVTFCIVKSFDKKKNQFTNEAVYIRLDK